MRLPARPHPRGVAQDFNPRIPYGMRQPEEHTKRHANIISIHASRMGCDDSPARRMAAGRNFNPRIPYGMRRSARSRCWCCVNFNPRIPYGMRPDDCIPCFPPIISIHASRMGCDRRRHQVGIAIAISIHASRMGCDEISRRQQSSGRNFNPRIPYGMRLDWPSMTISSIYFNPRIPYGMRLLPWTGMSHSVRFQSTHPVWDATCP